MKIPGPRSVTGATIRSSTCSGCSNGPAVFIRAACEAWLRRDLFSYANVPYRITNYAAMRRNPHTTIEFDAAPA